MLDNSYEIVGRIVVKDAAQPGAESVKKRLVDIENRATATGASISSALARGFAVLGGTALVGGALRGMIGLNVEIQSAQSALTGLFMSQTGASLKTAFQVSRQELRGLRADAAAGVGELSDYMGTYQAAASVGLPLGASLGELRELTRNAIAAGDIYRPGGEGMQLAGRDIQQALTGQIGDRTTPIVMAALRAAKISEDTYRAARPEEWIGLLNKAFAVYAPAVEMMGRTWSAQMSTLQDNVKEIIRTVTAPLFDRWTGALRRANEWIKDNREVLADTASKWGARLLTIWDHVIDNARTYLGLLVAAAAVQAAPTVIGATQGAGGALGRAGGALASGFRGVFSGVGGVAAADGAATGGAFAGLGASLARLAGPVALVATAVTAAYGAIVEFPGLLERMRASGAFLMRGLDGLAIGFGSLTQRGSALNIVGMALVEAFSWLGYIIGGAAMAVSAVGVAFGYVFTVLGEGMKFVYALMNGDYRGGMTAYQRMKDAYGNSADQLGEIIFGTGGNGIQGEQFGKPAELPKGEIPKPPNVNIGTVNMVMKTEMNADPARVIAAFEEGTDKLTRFRRSSSGNFGEV